MSPTHNPNHQQSPADDEPYARPAPPRNGKDGKDGKPDQLCEDERKAESRQEALVDEGVEESFPASDPPAVKRIT